MSQNKKSLKRVPGAEGGRRPTGAPGTALGRGGRWNARRKRPVAVECKWSVDGFDVTNLRAFRRQRPEGDNYLVSRDVRRPFTRNMNGLKVRFVDLETLVSRLEKLPW